MYYNLFYHLEDTNLLNSDNPVDLWCLHLPYINTSMAIYVDGWNHHPMSSASGRSPLQLWTRGMLTNHTCRRECANKGCASEHPRACSTDDVECFFSVMRDTIGKNFTTKEVQYGFRKICCEFIKRLNPDLPFYYHTSAHTRFSEGLLPDFNVPSRKKRRKHARVPQREQPAAFAPGRASMPVRGTLSVRAQFHNQPVELPPPPNTSGFNFEHSYSK